MPLLSIEMVSDESAFVSAGFAEASDFGVSGFFTIGPLQFAVVPRHHRARKIRRMRSLVPKEGIPVSGVLPLLSYAM